MSNERFTYEGRHLREWLLQLVEENPERRLEASTAINDHLSRVDLFGQPDWSLAQITEEFQKAIRETMREPSFPLEEYVKKAVSLKLRLGLQYNSLLKRRKAPPVDEAALTGIALGYVIDALGEELMPAAEELREMFNVVVDCRRVSVAISRMGVKAIEFYPDLMEGLKLPNLNGEYPMPLGVLLRHYPERIPKIVEMTGSADGNLRRNAIATLKYCGWETIHKFPEIEVTARERWNTSTGEDWQCWAYMLGNTAVSAETVSLFLEETRSCENWHVGTAIDCLGDIGRESERVVPRLIELLDEFEEYDSDWGWSGGWHARIVAALEKHGAAGKAAIPKLAQLIWSKPHRETGLRDPNEAVIKFLGRFGADAREALPALKEMEAKLGRDQCPDYLQEAIKKIEGTT